MQKYPGAERRDRRHRRPECPGRRRAAGRPRRPGQQLKATIVARTQLTSTDEFERIVLKTAAGGSVVRLADVARVEIGVETYGQTSSFNGLPSAGFGVQLASGANAITTADLVHAELDSLAGSLPEGVEVAYSYETTPFVGCPSRRSWRR